MHVMTPLQRQASHQRLAAAHQPALAVCLLIEPDPQAATDAAVAAAAPARAAHAGACASAPLLLYILPAGPSLPLCCKT